MLARSMGPHYRAGHAANGRLGKPGMQTGKNDVPGSVCMPKMTAYSNSFPLWVLVAYVAAEPCGTRQYGDRHIPLNCRVLRAGRSLATVR